MFRFREAGASLPEARAGKTKFYVLSLNNYKKKYLIILNITYECAINRRIPVLIRITLQ